MKKVKKMENRFIAKLINREVTHVAGFFAIHGDGAFLNGAGISAAAEDKNFMRVKSYWKNQKIPYVSSQAWRRWLRNTAVELNGWTPSPLVAVLRNQKGNTSKIATNLDPIDCPEDDIFGYMYASGKSKSDVALRPDLPDEQLVRPSPLRTSILRGVPELTFVSSDEGYVHLPDDQPLPYKTEFSSGEFIATFSLDVYRLGVFEKKGKINQELNPKLLEKYKSLLEEHAHPLYKEGNVIIMKNVKEIQNQRTLELLRALATLSGGAKMAQFGIDVSPRLLILAGMTRGNMIFDDLLAEDEGYPSLNLTLLKELIEDYAEFIKTPVLIGVREGYLKNQDEVRALHDQEVSGVKILVYTPRQAVEEFGKYLN